MGKIEIKQEPGFYEGRKWGCTICESSENIFLLKLFSDDGGYASYAFCKEHLIDLKGKIENCL